MSSSSNLASRSTDLPSSSTNLPSRSNLPSISTNQRSSSANQPSFKVFVSCPGGHLLEVFSRPHASSPGIYFLLSFRFWFPIAQYRPKCLLAELDYSKYPRIKIRPGSQLTLVLRRQVFKLKGCSSITQNSDIRHEDRRILGMTPHPCGIKSSKTRKSNFCRFARRRAELWPSPTFVFACDA